MQSKLEQHVMANVGTIYVTRALTGTRALAVYTLILSVWAIGRFAWVARVFQNFFEVERSGIGATAKFVVSALEHAHLGVQISLLLAAIAAAALLKDAISSLSEQQNHYSF